MNNETSSLWSLQFFNRRLLPTISGLFQLIPSCFIDNWVYGVLRSVKRRSAKSLEFNGNSTYKSSKFLSLCDNEEQTPAAGTGRVGWRGHSTVDTYLGHFQHGVIRNSVSTNTLVHAFWWTYIHISLGYPYLGVEVRTHTILYVQQSGCLIYPILIKVWEPQLLHILANVHFNHSVGYTVVLISISLMPIKLRIFICSVVMWASSLACLFNCFAHFFLCCWILGDTETVKL